MRYVTLAELSDLVRNNLDKVPHDIDLVVGIPRSGLLPANMIALFLNVRMTDIDSFAQGRIYDAGYRKASIKEGPVKKVLVVDDSVQSGRAIQEAKEKLSALRNDYEFVFLAPIVSSKGAGLVDIHFTVIDDYRFFEWNVFHHSILSNACVDIDGVLCKDPELDDDGPVYRQFLSEALPRFLPTVPIRTLISCRLEKYRPQTEQWLREHRIRYQELIMLDFPDRASRLKWGRHGEYKAEYYKKSGADLFIESSEHQARVIANKSHRPVLCIETNELLYEESFSDAVKRIARTRCPKTYARLKRLLGRG